MTLAALRPTQDTIDLVAALRGKWHGSYAMCLCPAHADSEPSLSIRQGEKTILVHCFAGCDPTDVLEAIARTKPIANSPRPDFSAGRGSANAVRLWDKAVEIAGTLGEAYLLERNLPSALPDVRYLHRCPFGKTPDAVFRPAVLVAVRRGSKILAIQRIALGRTGHKGKYMLGRPGEGAWAPDFRGSTLAVAESMEDAAAYTKLKGIPCWSSLGAERLPLIKIPDRVEKLIVAEDNNCPGRLSAQAAIEAHTTATREVVRDPPPRGCGDWAKVNETQGG